MKQKYNFGNDNNIIYLNYHVNLKPRKYYLALSKKGVFDGFISSHDKGLLLDKLQKARKNGYNKISNIFYC